MRCVCPFCGGTLPGKPGQFVKCRHCAETIHWVNNKPYRSQADAQEDARRLLVERREQARREQERKAKEATLAKERLEKEREQQRQRAEQIKAWREWRRRWTDAAVVSMATLIRNKTVRIVLFSVATLMVAWNSAALLFLGMSDEWVRRSFIYGTGGPHFTILGMYRRTSLSPEAAEALAKHEGYLDLSGLTSLSPETAEALAKHKGNLDLLGLTSLSDGAAEALRTNPRIRLPAAVSTPAVPAVVPPTTPIPDAAPKVGQTLDDLFGTGPTK
jgi:hypothetical protein